MTMKLEAALRRKIGVRSSSLLLGGIFCSGIIVGIVITVLAIAALPDTGSGNRKSGTFLIITCEHSLNLKKYCSPESRDTRPQLLSKPGKSLQNSGKFWVETVSDLPGPRIYILHNVVTQEEAAHLKSLGVIKGMEKALIIPYGGKDLIESSTRTNTGAWLDFGQDEVVRKVERVFADFTGTEPENGENLQVILCQPKNSLELMVLTVLMQILHYEVTQQFKEHHDYFDPAEDPPENFEPGGRMKAKETWERESNR